MGIISHSDEEIISATAFGKYIEDPMNEVTIASSSNDISVIKIPVILDMWEVLELEARKVIFDNKSEKQKNLLPDLMLPIW
jgi:hypothetical protein